MRSIAVNKITAILFMFRSDRAARTFVWSVWLVMMIATLIFLFTYIKSVPHNEDWFLVPPLTGNEPNLTNWLWDQNSNSEHRVPFTRLILLTLLLITHGDFRAGMLFNIFILGALAFAMILVARHLRGGRTSFADAFFPIVLLHLGHSENMFWSWQLTQVAPTVLAGIILLVLVGSQSLSSPKATIIAGLALILLPLNGANGLIFVPILALWLGYCGVRHWYLQKVEEGPRWTGVFLIGSAVVALALTGLYFVGYERPAWYPPPPTIEAAIQASAQFLALGFGPAARSSWVLSMTAVIVILVSSVIVVILGILHHKGPERQRALGIFLFFGNLALFALAMGWGRAAAIPILYGYWPIRYALFAVPALCLAFFIWELYGSTKFRAIVQMALFLGMFLLIPFNSMHGFGWLHWYHERDSWFEQDLIAGNSPATLVERHQEGLVAWIESNELTHLMEMLQETGMGPFAGIEGEYPVRPDDLISKMSSAPPQPVAPSPVSFTDIPLVTQELRYHLPEASGVYLVWGLNGWQVAPEELRPAGTEIRGNLMYTLMAQEGETFVVKLQVPAGTKLDYGFRARARRDASNFDWPSWDGDYQETPLENRVREVKTKLSLTLVPQEIHYHMPEAGTVYLVWGLNGWQVAPEELRPFGTKVKGNLMQTPMIQENDTFIAKVWVPVGSTIDYGFRITERQGLFDIAQPPIWDGDYQETPSENGITQVEGKATLVKDLVDVLNHRRLFLFGFTTFLSTWLIGFVFPMLPGKWKRGSLILAVNITPIVVAFFFGELYLKNLGFGFYLRTFPGEHQNKLEGVPWAQSDPVLGWISNKAAPEMNPQGFRDLKDFDKIDLNSGKIRVMVLGDSFMWGAGVRLEENLPNLLQVKLNNRYEFFNLSVPGWGIDQMYLAYQQYKDVIQPDIIILAFIDDDVNRVLESYRIWEGMNKPSFTVKNNELVLRTPESDRQSLADRVMAETRFSSKIMHQIYLATDAKAIVEQIFLNLARETEQRQARFVVVRIPTKDHFDLLSRVDRRLYNFEDTVKDSGLLYLDPAAEITRIPGWKVNFYLKDGHMSVLGNQYLADHLFRHVFEETDR